MAARRVRQRGASLEDEAIAELRTEEHAQQPADPEILFQDDGRQAPPGGRLLEVEPALVDRKLKERKSHVRAAARSRYA
jgi:hypothetical protein